MTNKIEEVKKILESNGVFRDNRNIIAKEICQLFEPKSRVVTAETIKQTFGQGVADQFDKTIVIEPKPNEGQKMISWEDTVIDKYDAHAIWKKEWHKDKRFNYYDASLKLAQDQAEISFRAGIKEGRIGYVKLPEKLDDLFDIDPSKDLTKRA